LTVNGTGGGGDLTAAFDAALQAPKCGTVGRSCDTGASLVLGRDGRGPEPNQPNTIADSCADGTLGRFHVRESIDRIKVATLDGTQLAPGKVVKVDVTVWGYSRGFADTLDLYYTGTAATPSWTYIGSVKSGKSGLHTISLNYTLPAGSMQAVRARYRFRGERASCGVGDYNDHDDLAFLAQ
jgi:leucyl aminopeptidase